MVGRSQIASIKSVVQGIVKIINDPRSNAKDLKEIIELDPPLTGKVLRVANSTFYASRTKIGEVMQAIVYIGFKALKEIGFSDYMALECGVRGKPAVALPECVKFLKSQLR